MIRQPLHHQRAGYPLPVRPWRVTTQAGTRCITHEVMATTAAQAIVSALELGGTGCELVACLRDGEWT
jgi:hypothetical protein